MAKARFVRIEYECSRDFMVKGMSTYDRPKSFFIDMLRKCNITTENTKIFRVDGKDVDPKHIDTLLKEANKP